FCPTYITGRYYSRIHLVDINSHPVVKNIALAFKILATSFNTVTDDAPVQLVYIFKALFQQIGRCLFTFDTTGTIGQYLFILQVLQLLHLAGKIPKVVNI